MDFCGNIPNGKFPITNSSFFVRNMNLQYSKKNSQKKIVSIFESRML